MPESQSPRKCARVHWQRDKLLIGTDGAGHTLIVDAPTERGGNGWGFKGGNLLLLSIGGCLATVLLEAAAARCIPVDDLEIKISAQGADKPFRYVDFEIAVILASSASYRELEKLVKIAERGCQVSNTIRSGAEFTLSLKHMTA